MPRPYKTTLANRLKGTAPAEFNFNRILRDRLHRLYDISTVDGYEQARTAAEAFVDKVVETALKIRDPKLRLDYAEFLFDRIEGKPKQQTQLTGSDGGAVQFQWKTEGLLTPVVIEQSSTDNSITSDNE